MIQLYDIFIFFYNLAIHIYSRFNKKAKLWVEGRKDIFKRLEAEIKPGEQIAWFHCASLGEFEQGRPVIEKFKVQCSTFKVLITFFSPSGYEIRKNYPGADYIFYLPIDTKKNAKKFISIVKPCIAVFIKYEFWYHYLDTLHKKQVPTYLISAIFRNNQHFFKWYGSLFRKLLKNFTQMFVQDEASQKLLGNIGLTNHSISGDTRFDRVYDIAQQAEEIPLIQQFSQGEKLLIAGSTWEIDEKLLIKLINMFDPDLKFIIAPHEIKEENIQRITSQVKHKTIKFSEANDENIADARVLVIDNIGMLSNLYQYGYITYIGGGFGKDIHNILEAAAFGMPVIFGPNYHKFQEAKDLIQQGGAFSINNYSELKSKVRFLLSNEYLPKIASEISRNYVKSKKGATQKILEVIGI
ncbi:MAG: glycosyltransferase N-terminal domain-containing protein [Bacteroidota bacterium]